MTTSRPDTSVSRRAALAGLGAGGLGVAFATRGVSAQDATPETAAHPIVGAWTWNNNPDDPNASTTFGIFHADGTYADYDPAIGPGIGAWTPTGERTLDALMVYQDNDLELDATEVGIGAFWIAIEVDAAGEHMTAVGELQATRPDGSVIVHLPYEGKGTRMTAKKPDWFGTPLVMPTG